MTTQGIYSKVEFADGLDVQTDGAGMTQITNKEKVCGSAVWSRLIKNFFRSVKRYIIISERLKNMQNKHKKYA